MPKDASPPAILRVLYCEDDVDTRDLMRFVFEAEGFEVICPEDPADCLRLAKGQRFDVYLLDNIMPHLKGTGLCEQIREFDSCTPVVFFSGATYKEDKDNAFAAGAQAYITKPAPMHEVVRVILNVVTSTRILHNVYC